MLLFGYSRPLPTDVRAGQPKKGASDAEGHGTVVRRAGPLCDAARLWRGVHARPAPGGAGGLWLCALSDAGRGALHVRWPREVSHARGWGDGVQDVCRYRVFSPKMSISNLLFLRVLFGA